MTTIKTNKVLNGLIKKGFCLAKGDHKRLIFYVNGKKTEIRTKLSHGNKEINDFLIHKMSIQIKLDKKQFIDLIDCPMTSNAYLKELQKQGFVSKHPSLNKAEA